MHYVFIYKKNLFIMASKKCLELLSLIFVGLLFTSGLLLFGSCVYLGYKLVTSSHSFKFAPSECIGPFILLILLGCTHSVLAKLGVSGVTKNQRSHIVWFKIGLVVQIVAEVAIGVWAVLLYKKITLLSTNLITTSFQNLLNNNYDKSTWESLQQELQCCGINNISDYRILSPTSGSIPVVCCKTDNCAVLYQNGCKDYLVKQIKTLMLDITLISFGSVAFLILGVIAFCYLHKAVTQEPQTQLSERTRIKEETRRMKS